MGCECSKEGHKSSGSLDLLADGVGDGVHGGLQSAEIDVEDALGSVPCDGLHLVLVHAAPYRHHEDEDAVVAEDGGRDVRLHVPRVVTTVRRQDSYLYKTDTIMALSSSQDRRLVKPEALRFADSGRWSATPRGRL